MIRVLKVWFSHSLAHALSPYRISFLSQRDVIIYIKIDSAAKSLQLCLTLCDPIDGNPPGSPVPGILQARTLEWVAISFSNV